MVKFISSVSDCGIIVIFIHGFMKKCDTWNITEVASATICVLIH